MKREAAEILKDALALPTEARAALAESLLESLDTEVDEDAEAAWATAGTAASPSSIAARSRPFPGPKCAADSPRADALRDASTCNPTNGTRS
jgi:Putative addiction module component